MKKWIALLLCLVIMVPVFGIGVYAEENESAEFGYRVERTVTLDGFWKSLFKKMFAFRGNSVQVNPTPDAVVPGEDQEVSDNTVSDFEKRVWELVNSERAKYGLQPLTLSKTLSDGARMKSKDMHDNRYFSHTSPTYGSPFDMMRSLGITYRTAGENIAMGYASPEAVVKAWMNSKGHRANILSASYTEIGVGYIADGGYYTQWFRG